jgi:hypothetical protein
MVGGFGEDVLIRISLALLDQIVNELDGSREEGRTAPRAG